MSSKQKILPDGFLLQVQQKNLHIHRNSLRGFIVYLLIPNPKLKSSGSESPPSIMTLPLWLEDGEEEEKVADYWHCRTSTDGTPSGHLILFSIYCPGKFSFSFSVGATWQPTCPGLTRYPPSRLMLKKTLQTSTWKSRCNVVSWFIRQSERELYTVYLQEVAFLYQDLCKVNVKNKVIYRFYF